MLKRSTSIKESPKKLDVTSLMMDVKTATIKLSTLETLDSFQKVTVNIKVVDIKEIIEVDGKEKQDVTVADESSVARVSVWEGNVNIMKHSQSYCLKDFMVREYQNTKYLTMAKDGSEIIPIEDIGGVAEKTEDNELYVIKNVTVGGVPYFDTYKSCLQCKARVEPETEARGKCSKPDEAKVRSLPTTHYSKTHSCMTRMGNRKHCLHLLMGRLFMRLLVVMFQLTG